MVLLTGIYYSTSHRDLPLMIVLLKEINHSSSHLDLL